MQDLPFSLQKKIDARKKDNTFRTVSILSDGIDFYSNDYLGFSTSDKIAQHALKILKSTKNINGSTGSRLISGTHPLHLEVETMLANYHNAPAGLLYNSGYDANVGLFSSILQKGDVILYDELIHASIRDGIKMSNAKAYKFKHNNLKDLSLKIDRFKSKNLYIVIETIYSMDGDAAPLQEIVKIANEHSAHVIVDEAHATGVVGLKGQGMVSYFGLESCVFARIHTFGKALGCHGAIVLGSEELVSYLVNFSRSFIYSTAISLHALATIKAAYTELSLGKHINVLSDKIIYFREQLRVLNISSRFISSNSAIQCCVIPGNEQIKNIVQKIQSQNILVKPILSPTIPKGKERIRVCLHNYNTKNQISILLNILAHVF